MYSFSGEWVSFSVDFSGSGLNFCFGWLGLPSYGVSNVSFGNSGIWYLVSCFSFPYFEWLCFGVFALFALGEPNLLLVSRFLFCANRFNLMLMKVLVNFSLFRGFGDCFQFCVVDSSIFGSLPVYDNGLPWFFLAIGEFWDRVV